jgi:hypothetical protein
MALRRNSLLAGAIAAVVSSGPVMAGGIPNNYIYDYMGHSDSITIGLGDAPTSNIIIQHPTPWPSYINNTRIKTSGQQGIKALQQLLQNSGGQSASSSSMGGGGASGAVSSSAVVPGQ